MAAQQRPLSPHLQIYQRQLTSVLSIMHRGTGVLLGIAAFALVLWLMAVAGDSTDFAAFNGWIASTPGMISLLAVTAALTYHLLNGVRHLLWDIGWGFELRQVYLSGWVVVGLAIAITAAIAFAALNASGVA